MHPHISEEVHPGIITIQGMLRKIDCLRLPLASRRDVESILVRQVGREIDRALPWQAGHGRRTAAISLLIGQAVGMTTEELHALKLAAFLHDIGLLMLPHDLTIGGNRFDPESYVTVQNHPRLGASLLEPFFFLREATVLIAHHHERWDGSGYPYGIRGQFIPLGSRILSIADAFDAIRVPEVSDRVVRNTIALRIIQVAAGTQFDPELVDSIVAVPGIYSKLRSCRTNDKKLLRFTVEVMEDHHVFFSSSLHRVVGRSSWIFISLLLVGCSGGSSAPAPPSVAATGTPGAETDVGERLFVETRFAQAFKVHLDSGGNINDPLPAGDPVMDLSETTGQGVGLTGPFAGLSMNCRACHFVDEHVGTPGGGMRTYADFAQRSPIPNRRDGKRTAPRNSPPLVNASLDRPGGTLFHFDGEFSTMEDLIVGTFTGRNFGWLPGQKAEAISHIAQVMREDDGSGVIAQQFDGLSYAALFTGANANIPDELRLPPEFRVLIGSASDQEIFDAVVKVVAAYVDRLAILTSRRQPAISFVLRSTYF